MEGRQLTKTVPVRPDGKISLPLLNDVQAAGLTPTQLATQITESLKKFVTDPQVTVIVREINSQRVYLLGEVTRAGAYPLLPGMTVLQALSSAGGFTQFANIKKIYVLRSREWKAGEISVQLQGSAQLGSDREHLVESWRHDRRTVEEMMSDSFHKISAGLLFVSLCVPALRAQQGSSTIVSPIRATRKEAISPPRRFRRITHRWRARPIRVMTATYRSMSAPDDRPPAGAQNLSLGSPETRGAIGNRTSA